MSRELGNLCYNIPNQSIYGEITNASLEKLCQYMKTNQENVHILDIGSGSCFTLCILAKQYSNQHVQITGIEISKERNNIALQIIPKLFVGKEWKVITQDILLLEILRDNYTHSFHFDKTFPANLMQHIEKLEFQCKSIKYVVTNNKKYYLDNWQYIACVACKLRGSSQCMNFYVFCR